MMQSAISRIREEQFVERTDKGDKLTGCCPKFETQPGGRVQHCKTTTTGVVTASEFFFNGT